MAKPKSPIVESQTVSFNYNENEYSEKIQGVLELKNLTPPEVKEALNKASGKFAYWSALLADISDDIFQHNLKYDLWYAKKYLLIDEELTPASAKDKKTETYIKNYFMKKYETEYEKIMKKKGVLALAHAKCTAIVKAFDMQSRTLQSINSMNKSELDKIIHNASSSMDDIDD
jgi:hypothetical protein